MGHKDVRLTLNVYGKAVKRRSKLSGAIWPSTTERWLGTSFRLVIGHNWAQNTKKPDARSPKFHRIWLDKANSAPWRSGYAAACKAVYTGSIPVGAFFA